MEEEGERETGGEKEEESEFLFCFRQRFFDAVQERRKEKNLDLKRKKKLSSYLSGLDSSSTMSNPTTCLRNKWSCGCDAGSSVASNRGPKMLSIKCSKLPMMPWLR